MLHTLPESDRNPEAPVPPSPFTTHLQQISVFPLTFSRSMFSHSPSADQWELLEFTTAAFPPQCSSTAWWQMKLHLGISLLHVLSHMPAHHIPSSYGVEIVWVSVALPFCGRKDAGHIWPLWSPTSLHSSCKYWIFNWTMYPLHIKNFAKHFMCLIYQGLQTNIYQILYVNVHSIVVWSKRSQLHHIVCQRG